MSKVGLPKTFFAYLSLSGDKHDDGRCRTRGRNRRHGTWWLLSLFTSLSSLSVSPNLEFPRFAIFCFGTKLVWLTGPSIVALAANQLILSSCRLLPEPEAEQQRPKIFVLENPLKMAEASAKQNMRQKIKRLHFKKFRSSESCTGKLRYFQFAILMANY